MQRILFIGDRALYKKKFKTTIQALYQIDFSDSLSVESANYVFLSYDMVLLDYNVLKEHSYDLCSIAKKKNISVLFLFETNCIEQDILHSFNKGADDYLYPSLSTTPILFKKIELILSKRTPGLHNNIYQDSHMILVLTL